MSNRARDQRRRTLSQNFLQPKGVETFLRACDWSDKNKLIEIGAGQGVITEALAKDGRSITAYELDPMFGQQTLARLRTYDNVQVVVGDFFAAPDPNVPFHLVGNVPFSRTSDLVAWGISNPLMLDATLITQLEYAKKRTGGYGRWSLVTVTSWPDFTWELVSSISRHHFRPVPSVDAGILRIARRRKALVAANDRDYFQTLVDIGFKGKGGTLFKSLSREFGHQQIAKAFHAAEVEHSRIVAFVEPHEWIRIHEALTMEGGREAGEPRPRRPRKGRAPDRNRR